MDRGRLMCLFVFVALGLHCTPDDYHETFSNPRLLDRLCKSGACTASGTARQVRGLTDDSVAFEIQPGHAEIYIPPEDQSLRGGREALVAGEGTLDGRKLTNEGDWIPWGDSSEPVEVELSGSAPAWILDLRSHGYDYEGCM